MSDAPMEPMDPDAALMVAFQKGDVAAFEQLLGKYHRSIVNFIYKIVNNSGEAEELAQEVFLRVYRAREAYEPRARFSAWLYRIAANVGLKAAKRNRLLPFGARGSRIDGGNPNQEALLVDPKPNAEDQLLGHEMGRIVRDAIRSLPRREKVALILRRYEGLSYKEISEVMCCTEAAVKTYIHRGKLRVRTHILPYLLKGLN